MTQEEKIRNLLYEKKLIADYKDEDPFVGIYFRDLIDLLITNLINYYDLYIKENKWMIVIN